MTLYTFSEIPNHIKGFFLRSCIRLYIRGKEQIRVFEIIGRADVRKFNCHTLESFLICKEGKQSKEG